MYRKHLIAALLLMTFLPIVHADSVIGFGAERDHQRADHPTARRRGERTERQMTAHLADGWVRGGDGGVTMVVVVRRTPFRCARSSVTPFLFVESSPTQHNATDECTRVGAFLQ